MMTSCKSNFHLCKTCCHPEPVEGRFEVLFAWSFWRFLCEAIYSAPFDRLRMTASACGESPADGYTLKFTIPRRRGDSPENTVIFKKLRMTACVGKWKP